MLQQSDERCAQVVEIIKQASLVTIIFHDLLPTLVFSSCKVPMKIHENVRKGFGHLRDGNYEAATLCVKEVAVHIDDWAMLLRKLISLSDCANELIFSDENK